MKLLNKLRALRQSISDSHPNEESMKDLIEIGLGSICLEDILRIKEESEVTRYGANQQTYN